ncbi:TPA: DUF551 domain-containing protein [Escherichia coli]|nr:DUF551 domain-containing protein [Escherichia coli]
MTTITKERLLTIKQWRETYGPGSNVVLPAEEAEELARIALASLEAEPIGFRCRRNDNLGDWSYVYHREPDDFERKHLVIEGIYAAPPAPVVPEEATPENVEMLSGYVSTYKLTDSERDIAAEIWNACRAAMLQSGNFRENKNSSTNNFREIAETSTNYPAIPSEVLSAILKVARIRADFDDFDGDRRGIGDCLDEAEQELIVTINKYASQLAAEPIAANDVREQQTAVPPVPEIQADVAQAIENLKQKLVECNRYNYCADAVKGVEDACRAAMLHGAEPVSQTYKSQHTQFEQVADLYEMQFDDGRTCAFHTDAQKAAQWLQACDGNRVQEYVKLERLRNALSGNYPVTPDGWISCSERMPDKLIPVMVMYEDGEMWSAMWNGNRWDDGTEYPDPHSVTHWREMPAAPKQEVNRG